MNCPTCSNPIMNLSTTCEWCGSILLTDQNIGLSSFSPTKTYKILFSGTVYIGYFEGSVKIGDSLKFIFKNSVISGIVKGIEINRTLINSYEGKGEIGILI